MKTSFELFYIIYMNDLRHHLKNVYSTVFMQYVICMKTQMTATAGMVVLSS